VSSNLKTHDVNSNAGLEEGFKFLSIGL
jgi:hypothetical protein